MKEVTQEEFYKHINPLDVVLSVKGSFPYTVEFSLRYGKLVGKTIESYTNYNYPIITKYYLNQ